MTVRALGYAQLAGIVQNDCPFSDVTMNRGYVALAYHMGFMGGVSAQRFSPRTASTREQAAAVLLRVDDRLHAPLARRPVESAPSGAVYVETISDVSGRIPMCPRAPLESVYAAAVKAGADGAVVLRTTPWAASVKDGKTVSGTVITDEALTALLADETTMTYRSTRYASSYLIHPEEGGQTVVWYESEEDVSQKLALCRLLGVAAVYVG